MKEICKPLTKEERAELESLKIEMLDDFHFEEEAQPVHVYAVFFVQEVH